MLESLRAQKTIHDQFVCEYFFCTPKGCAIHLSNLRKKVWIPALKEASLSSRGMKQTRHTFATMALSFGENPLWVAAVMGHRDTEMIIEVYTRYVANSNGTEDGLLLNAVYCKKQVAMSRMDFGKIMSKIKELQLIRCNPLIFLMGRQGLEPRTS